jgi:VanZ family protein
MPPAVAGIDDAWLHGTSYFFLALLARVTFSSSSLSIFRLHFEAKSAMFSMGYGALLEGVQQIVPGRSASFSDWLWDGAGVFLALAFVRLRDFFGGKKQSSFS